MIELNPCKECGIPEYIAKEHSWLDNGDIVQSREAWHRLIFIESENIDPLWHGIESIIGLSIEHLIIACQRRITRNYISQFIPEAVKELVRAKRIEQRPLTAATGDIGRMVGFGNYQYVDHRYELDEDDFYTASVEEPFSLHMAVGSLAGDIEALTGRDQGVRYEKVGPDTYHVTSFPAKHPEELRGRMPMERYYHESGGNELEKCPACGAPKALSRYAWDLKRGVIQNQVTKRRMVIIGWQNLDPIFEELEAELGDTMPDAIIEAQRRFARGGFYSLEGLNNEADLRGQLALRGFGSLQEMHFGRKGLRIRMTNVVLPLIIVALAQGLYEMSSGIDAHVEWECSNGCLEVAVTP